MNGDQVLQLLLSGLTVGSIYALVAVGFAVVYNVTGVINFAQGEFAMLGALGAAGLVRAGLPLAAAAVVAVVAVTALGAALQRFAIYPARNYSPLAIISVTVGLAIALRGFAVLVWGTDSYTLPAFTGGEPLRVFGATVVRQSLWVTGLSAIAFVALLYFFNRTILGTAVRASVDNPVAARLMGIRPQRMALLSWALSAALGALAGVVVAPITFATYDMGVMLGLKSFVAALLGGVTNAPAAIVGGLLLGVIESLAAGLINPGYRDAIAFFLLLVVLFVRPAGLFPRATAQRV